MAEKISKLVITVDLDCHCCYKKIQKVLCKLKEQENIKDISYDVKENTVTVSGPFDPEKLSQKLRSKAGCAIKDIKIVKDEKPTPPPKEENITTVINGIRIIVGGNQKCQECPHKKPCSKPKCEKCKPPGCRVCCSHGKTSKCCSCGKDSGWCSCGKDSEWCSCGKDSGWCSCGKVHGCMEYTC